MSRGTVMVTAMVGAAAIEAVILAGHAVAIAAGANLQGRPVGGLFIPVAKLKEDSVIDPHCAVCFGMGWVCENHPERAWNEKTGCHCGAGMPCECQHANGLEQPDVSKLLQREDMEVQRKN